MTDYDPRIWGMHGWKFLYSIADGYPDNPTEKDKNHYSTLFKMLEYTLPCKECRENFSLHIKETPIKNYLKSSYSLSEWVTIIHNKVNLMLGRKLIIHEKTRQQRVKHNLVLTSGKRCCGAQKGRNTMSEVQRQQNIEALQKRERAKKTLYQIVKENKKKRKRKRKDLN